MRCWFYTFTVSYVKIAYVFLFLCYTEFNQIRHLLYLLFSIHGSYYHQGFHYYYHFYILSEIYLNYFLNFLPILWILCYLMSVLAFFLKCLYHSTISKRNSNSEVKCKFPVLIWAQCGSHVLLFLKILKKINDSKIWIKKWNRARKISLTAN